ncbi:MAG: tripartite tricarboxylate transporter substrate binding protein [Deltaproteobacteria bacterium HGW-Deltaproteobacteria-15]|jgi:tripartite-type tricarboxylate transporter receptor subunit TctC|nr:MAG: tripartite tricarboxylate transporter substrate binding protein [Deltaproteobacteria bacterium HGW-Deltaproteobacteria-15]
MKRLLRNSVVCLTFFAAAAVMFGSLIAPATAQDKYPARAIEYVVPWGPGGGADQLARKSGVLLEKILNVPFPVINVPGATGGTGITKLLAGAADGHAIAIYIADSHAVLATGQASWKMSDIVPVARMILAPSFLFVAENGRFKSWADFEKEAKAKPGTLKVGTLGFGSVDDITLTYLEGKGIKIVQVPYSKPSERYVSVLGGHVDALYEQAGDVRQYITGKQIRPIIVFGSERFAVFKDVPCSKELGYDIGLPQFRSIVAKGGTDPKRVKILSDAFQKAAATPEYKAFLEEQFSTPDSFMNAEGTAKFIQAELDTMKATYKPKAK